MLLRKPTKGIDGCARAASGQPTAAPPSSVTKSRVSGRACGFLPKCRRHHRPASGCAGLVGLPHLPACQGQGQPVLGAGLNCSEIEVLRCTAPIRPMAGQGPGCVKTLTLETFVGAQQKNRTCGLSESFMRGRHPVRIYGADHIAFLGSTTMPAKRSRPGDCSDKLANCLEETNRFLGISN
jgi:hypothetical protein